VHVGVPGNEAADRAAKEAAGLILTTETCPERQRELELLQTLMATTKPIIRAAMRGEWEISWEKAKYGRNLFRLRVQPGKDILKFHTGTYRAISLVIT
jgi:hypothetical protein